MSLVRRDGDEAGETAKIALSEAMCHNIELSVKLWIMSGQIRSGELQFQDKLDSDRYAGYSERHITLTQAGQSVSCGKKSV